MDAYVINVRETTRIMSLPGAGGQCIQYIITLFGILQEGNKGKIDAVCWSSSTPHQVAFGHTTDICTCVIVTHLNSAKCCTDHCP